MCCILWARGLFFHFQGQQYNVFKSLSVLSSRHLLRPVLNLPLLRILVIELGPSWLLQDTLQILFLLLYKVTFVGSKG